MTRTASTAPSVALKPEAITRSSTAADGDPAFVAALLKTLEEMPVKFALAKILLKGQEDLVLAGFIRGEYKSSLYNTIRGVRFGVRSSDTYPVPDGYGKFFALGSTLNLPLDHFRGFLWLTKDQEKSFFEPYLRFHRAE